MTDNQAALDAALAQIDAAFGKDAPPLPKPESMTELVARAMCQAHHRHQGLEWEPARIATNSNWRSWIQDARELLADMSTPTEEMLDDAEGWQMKDSYDDLETERERIEFLWWAMMICAEYEYDEEGNSRAEKRAAEKAAWDALSPEEQEARWAGHFSPGSSAPF